MTDFATVILAAGKGTRMKSELPKVLHRVCGKPMVQHVIDAACAAGAQKTVVVVGFGADQVQEALDPGLLFALQAEQLGTGHAVMQAESQLRDFTGPVLVLYGDTPLLTGELLRTLVAHHTATGAAATILTAKLDDPAGYGRVVREINGRVAKIVEQKDATTAELAINEINTGIYCFAKELLFTALSRINRNNAQGEYYLTDCIEILFRDGQRVEAVIAPDATEIAGINSRRQLAEAERILRDRIRERLMDAGVTLMDPASIFIDSDVTIAPDTVIYPYTIIEGRSRIGGRCQIGPYAHIINTTVGDEVTVHFAHVRESSIGNQAALGPFVHIRPGTSVGQGVRIGNFVETKNSQIGDFSKIPHLSYIGDTTMGSGVNIGSGTITVNYDGKTKHRTIIEDEAFIGCNSNLVAPVTVGKGAYIAAGSTITRDVPPEALGVARSRQQNIEGWAKRRRTGSDEPPGR